MEKSKKTSDKSDQKVINLSLRYLFLLILAFSLPLIYLLFTPLTSYVSGFLLKLFYDSVNISINSIIVTTPTCVKTIEIISSCVAGSAYLLLLILNLSVSLNIKKRIYSLIFSIFALFLLNILRILVFSVLFITESNYYDVFHMFFWYLLSIIFVIGIWFLEVFIFKIKSIPFYTDLKYLLKNSVFYSK